MPRSHYATALLLLAGVLRAHPEIDAALARLNADIVARPTDGALYLERGELYARHDDPVAAEANYLRAAELTPDLPRLNLARGALELAAGRPAEARRLLDPVIARTPQDVEARVLRARALVALKETAAAVADFSTALAAAPTPSPDLYLERAALLPPAAALASIDEGIARLGPTLALQLRAAALEESLGRIDDAAARLNRVAAQSERKESWLKRRGDLYARAGRGREARDSYREALTRITDLPDWLRTSPEVKQLADELRRLSNP
jgi:tetratricopeptide (TPR) repeat protein